MIVANGIFMVILAGCVFFGTREVGWLIEDWKKAQEPISATESGTDG